MQKRFFTILIFCAILFVGNGCKDFVQVGPPSNKVVAATVFQNEATATAAINGLYTKMTFNSLYFTSGGATAYLACYADELFYTSTSAASMQFTEGALAVNNAIVYTNFLGYAYQLIYATNSCIAGLQAAPISNAVREQLLGEAHFIRAYCYWTLATLYGDVPLVLSVEDYAATVQMRRTPVAQVFNQIFADMNQAKTSLKPAYPTAGRYRPNYYTVIAMLSRMHTYLGNWNEALAAGNDVNFFIIKMYLVLPTLLRVFGIARCLF